MICGVVGNNSSAAEYYQYEENIEIEEYCHHDDLCSRVHGKYV